MVRFGIAGFGLHAVKRLMPGFALAQRAQVTALSRRDLRQAEASARQFQVPHAFASTSDLCASPEVDAVFVATPDALHLADVVEAVRHGKPVLCEKPMARTYDEARAMVQTARAAGVLLGVAHVMRFEESVRYIRGRIASGAVGRPVMARCDFFAPMLSSPRAWVNDPTLATGGPLADIGVHCIDTLRFVLGSEVSAVSAHAAHDSHSPLEATAAAMLQFVDALLATVSVSARSPYQTFLEVTGDEATISALNALTVDYPVTIELRRGRDALESREVSNANAYGLQVDAFATAVEERRDFEIPGEEGLQNQAIVDAAYRSVKSGRVESV